LHGIGEAGSERRRQSRMRSCMVGVNFAMKPASSASASLVMVCTPFGSVASDLDDL
jgi:hypothetical protein